MGIMTVAPQINIGRIDRYWTDADQKESRMHRIHFYPAKFPHFLVSRALNVAKKKQVRVNTIADVFCGCGTTALEARKHGVAFWGCDINPVATLIAKVKSETYKEDKLIYYYKKIETRVSSNAKLYDTPKKYLFNQRISYWFQKKKIKELSILLDSIRRVTPIGKYRNFFLCAFSNILKPSSRWLTKSIKPQIDPDKKPLKVSLLFKKQFEMMLKATNELRLEKDSHPKSKIITSNFLTMNANKSFADLVLTSPPYVTSYEYADIHQLSTLWLGFASDYRELRSGTIGSLFNGTLSEDEYCHLNDYAKRICSELKKKDERKARSVAKYFYDMRKTVQKTNGILKDGGLAIFVIGNTEYLGTKVNNASYLYQCLLDEGFSNVEISKRVIKGKTLSPYRDFKGCFSKDPKQKKIYKYEYVLVAKKNKLRNYR